MAAAFGVGAVGINLEDSPGSDGQVLLAPERQAERIRAARTAARATGIDLVINVRTDVYLTQAAPSEARFDETVRRARLYFAAGADCLFVPGVIDADTIGALVGAIDGPLNIMAGPGAPTTKQLGRSPWRRSRPRNGRRVSCSSGATMGSWETPCPSERQTACSLRKPRHPSGAKGACRAGMPVLRIRGRPQQNSASIWSSFTLLDSSGDVGATRAAGIGLARCARGAQTERPSCVPGAAIHEVHCRIPYLP